ncbi:MAG: hypothetical protein OEX19_11285 [Gammaproteobacteria bacterium]|nr:hypothetical protein [Gammaproteobacteria bacterium]
MKKLTALFAFTVLGCALVFANTESRSMQLKVLPTHSVVLMSASSLGDDGTQNIEMEILGLNPEQKFEVTFKEKHCNSMQNNKTAMRSAVVTSSKHGSIVGFYSGKNGLGLGAIGIKALEDTQNICLDVSA